MAVIRKLIYVNTSGDYQEQSVSSDGIQVRGLHVGPSVQTLTQDGNIFIEAGNLDLNNSGRTKNALDPVDAQDYCTKTFTEALVSGFISADLSHPIVVSYLDITETVSRQFSISSGTIWRYAVALPFTAYNSLSDKFTRSYQDGAGGFSLVTLETAISNTTYDDGSGVLAAIPLNGYVSNWLYIREDATVHVVTGRVVNDSLVDAENEVAPTDIPLNLQEQDAEALLIFQIIIREGDDNLQKTIKYSTERLPTISNSEMDPADAIRLELIQRDLI